MSNILFSGVSAKNIQVDSIKRDKLVIKKIPEEYSILSEFV